MDGFRAYKYYMALKLHFTNEKFNVFTNRGRLRGRRPTFEMRNDRGLFERLAREYPDERQCISMIASNMMYGHFDVVYDIDQSARNFEQYDRRKQAMTKIFADDCQVIADAGIDYMGHSSNKFHDIIQLHLAGKVTVETLSILNDLDGLIDQTRNDSCMSTLFGDLLLRVKKSHGFVKYNKSRITPAYLNFLEETASTNHG